MSWGHTDPEELLRGTGSRGFGPESFSALGVGQLRLDEALHLLFLRQLEQVLRHKDPVLQAGQRVLDQSMILLRAEQNPDRPIVPWHHHVLAIPGYVRVQLADVL